MIPRQWGYFAFSKEINKKTTMKNSKLQPNDFQNWISEVEEIFGGKH